MLFRVFRTLSMQPLVERNPTFSYGLTLSEQRKVLLGSIFQKILSNEILKVRSCMAFDTGLF